MRQYLYWLIPLILFILQSIFTFNTLNQIRYEELEESVVNPYWFAHGLVQNGATSDLGWYFLLVIVYKLFGFSLFTGKFVRLGIVFIALLCLSALLKKYLGKKLAWLPLLTISLSPTILYFNTQQTIYGLDTEYFIICLYLLLNIDFSSRKKRTILKEFLFLTLLMLSWLTYPAFIYYLPALLMLYYSGLFKDKIKFTKSNMLVFFESMVMFLTPLLLVFFFIKNRNLLIYDPIARSGIFRGAGFFKLDLGIFIENLRLNLKNLFLDHFGYYYEINKVEFSHFFPVLSIIFITFITVVIFRKQKKLRFLILLSLSILLFNVFIAYFTIDPTPGMRRYTGILVSLYSLLVLSWYYANNLPGKLRKYKSISILICSLLLIHHIMVFPINYSHLKDPSQYRETVWFKTINNPGLILNDYLQTVQKQDLKLACFDSNGKPLNCRYSEIFATIKAACQWNKLTCHDIYGFDLRTGKYVKLEIKLFNNYYFGLYGREIIAT